MSRGSVVSSDEFKRRSSIQDEPPRRGACRVLRDARVIQPGGAGTKPSPASSLNCCRIRASRLRRDAVTRLSAAGEGTARANRLQGRPAPDSTTWREGDDLMSQSNVRANHRHAVAPSAPAEVHCAPTPPSADGSALPSPGPAPGERSGDQPARPVNAPGRSLDAIMQAFRQQRRLTQAQGSPAAVIADILSRTGGGSLLADLKRHD